ncbi:DUF3052 family protein [Streptomyces sp. NPDC054883]
MATTPSGWREGAGDLVDALTGAIGNLDDRGFIWGFTSKSGQDGHIPPADVSEAADTAGPSRTTAVSAATNWTDVRLVARRPPASGRRGLSCGWLPRPAAVTQGTPPGATTTCAASGRA